MCTAQSGEALCVLHGLERYCVCTAQSREALCVLHGLERHCVCTVQCREALCVYCTVWRGTVFILHSVEGHSFFTLLIQPYIFQPSSGRLQGILIHFVRQVNKILVQMLISD